MKNSALLRPWTKRNFKQKSHSDVVDLHDSHAAGVRTDNHPGQNVAQNERLAQPLGDYPANQTRYDDNGDVRRNAH